MKRMIARGLGATGMLVLLSGGVANAQQPGQDWVCTSWRETPPTQVSPPGRECTQWSKGQTAATPVGQVPSPPFMQAAKPGDAKAKAADQTQKPQKRKKHRRRR